MDTIKKGDRVIILRNPDDNKKFYDKFVKGKEHAVVKVPTNESGVVIKVDGDNYMFKNFKKV